ncbi:MAG: hypothetical protein ACTSRL_14350 [Candidatus Helarchaeota archaeon]|nr:hypothetical protein [Deltaproteobacteria bacterium]
MPKSLKPKNWVKWWGLKRDTLNDVPLITNEYIDDLLVETSNVKLIDLEVENIKDLDMGYIKVIIGARGAGKSSMGYYLASKFKEEPQFLPIFVDTKDYTPLISGKSQVPIQNIRMFIFAAAIKELIKMTESSDKLEFLRPEILQLADRLETLAGGTIEAELQLFSMRDLEKLFAKIRSSNKRILFIIDNLDKLKSPQESKLIKEYFSKDQGTFQGLLTKYKINFIITSAIEWLEPFRDPDLSYIDLDNGISLDRLTFDETKEIIKNRLQYKDNLLPTFHFPFTDAAIQKLLSYTQGNPRKIISYAKLLLINGARHELKRVDVKEVDEVLGDKVKIQYEEDFRTAISSRIEFSGASILYRLFDYLDKTEKARSEDISTIIEALYHHKKKITIDDELSNILENYNIVYYKRRGNPVLNKNVRKFFQRWEQLRHTVQEFLEWYPLNLMKPIFSSQIDTHFDEIFKDLEKSKEAQKYLTRAKAIFYKDLTDEAIETTPPNNLILSSWNCIEALIKALALNYLVRQEENIEQFSIINVLALGTKKLTIRLRNFNFIKQLKTDRNTAAHSSWRFRPEQSRARIQMAKEAIEELITKWGIAISKPLEKFSRCSPECRYFLCKELISDDNLPWKKDPWVCLQEKSRCTGRYFSRQIGKNDCTHMICNAPIQKRCIFADRIF